ncbi:sugar transferase [Bacillus salipaludis]|uniref:Sugar transferase n=1 Tax=Bacillus salipaludis TaxID=2547811 RepID=A0A4R5VW22_9BACI|nr:sugar transferase [Bacillus salipaludis]MDQ6600120.1 sugar transferase [Bacillus salipaludis]TDK62414.1 sugar transferase [Bacillus salipaludis]
MNEDFGRRRYVKMFLAVVDITIVFTGFILANGILQQFSIMNMELIVDYSWLIVVSAASVVPLYLYDLYTDWRRKGIHHLVYSIVLSMIIFSGLESIISLLTPYLPFQPSYILAAFLIQTTLLTCFHVCVWYINKKLFGKKKVYIIGEASNAGLYLAGKLLNHHNGWFEIEGFIPLEKKRNLHEYVKKCDLFLLSPAINRKDCEEIARVCIRYGKEILMVPQLFELSFIGANTQQIDDMLVVSIKPPLLNVSQKISKRIFDVMVSAVLLVIASPFFMILFFLIPLTSKGPAFFKQERIGLDGKPYWIYKFRSMIQDAEKRTGPVLATDKDPRITLVGRIIRAVRLDELPQLINVLKGEMSLVGPRPEREYFINQFKQTLPDYPYRLTVKPGITGLAQVLANYTTPVEDKLRFDLLYVRNYSFTLDIKILFQTIRVVLQREQAQGVKEGSIYNQKLLKRLEKNKVMNH